MVEGGLKVVEDQDQGEVAVDAVQWVDGMGDPWVAVSGAMLGTVDTMNETVKRVRGYFDRRSVVEAMVEDEEAFRVHTKTSKRFEDTQSMVALVADAATSLSVALGGVGGALEALTERERKRVPSGAKKVWKVSKGVLDAAGVFRDAATSWATGDPLVDDNDGVLVEALDLFVTALFAGATSAAKARRKWAKGLLSRKHPKVMAALREAGFARRNNLTRAKELQEQGKLTQVQVAQVLGGASVDAVLNQPEKPEGSGGVVAPAPALELVPDVEEPS